VHPVGYICANMSRCTRPQSIKFELKIFISNRSWSLWYRKRMRGFRSSQAVQLNMPSLLGCHAVSWGVWFPLHRYIVKCGSTVITFTLMAQGTATYLRRLESRYLVWLFMCYDMRDFTILRCLFPLHKVAAPTWPWSALKGASILLYLHPISSQLVSL